MCKRITMIVLLAPSLLHAAAPLELESSQGMVVTSQHYASDVGAAILKQGGNARSDIAATCGQKAGAQQGHKKGSDEALPSSDQNVSGQVVTVENPGLSSFATKVRSA